MKEAKPRYFILENVASMPASARDEITKVMGVEPIMIDAALVSAQTRKRLFWTNIPGVELPEDRGILVRDILEKNVPEKYFIQQSTLDRILAKKVPMTRLPQSQRIRSINGKASTLASTSGGGGKQTGLYFIPGGKLYIKEATKKGYAEAVEGDAIDISFPASKTRRGRVGNKVKTLMTSGAIAVFTGGRVRRLTPVECERLQGLPDHYTSQGLDPEGRIFFASDAKRYEATGNAFNSDVIAHIASFIPGQKKALASSKDLVRGRVRTA